MQQIFVIHGGNAYDTYEDFREQLKNTSLDYDRLKPQTSWKIWLRDQLPGSDVLAPTMPNNSNAQYDEWCVMFEKLLPFFKEDVTLVGHSLGAIFLVKYISTRPLPRTLSRLILVAAPYDDETKESLGSFRLDSAPHLADSAKEIHFMHAKDDVVVPFSELAKYRVAVSSAQFHEYETGNHFFWPEFPELLEIIKQK